MFMNIILPPLMIFAGGFFLIKLNFFFILHPIRTLKFTFKGQNTKKSLGSLLLALAGTLGVGNIVGVAAGLMAGGAGSVFWLILSSLFSSAVKYAEVSLSYDTGEGLGMISVIEDDRAPLAKARGKSYAILCILLSLSMGALLQGSAIRDSSASYIKTPLFSIALTTFCCAVILKGGTRIKKAVAVTVPLAVCLYTGMCLFVIIPNFGRLPGIILKIIGSAFNVRSLCGGIGAFLIKSGMKEGFAVGLLSNEAGAGTSSFSHTSHNGDDSKRAGCFGIMEVLFDTFVLCPLTAFTILLGGKNGSGGIADIKSLFQDYIGPVSGFLLTFSVTAFAVSTILCWYFYGEICLRYIGIKYLHPIYFILFTAVLYISLSFDTVYGFPLSGTILSDTTLFFLCLLTLYTLIKRSGSVKAPPEIRK